MVDGYNMKEGIAYDETFSPVVRMGPIRILRSFVAFIGFKFIQIDVKIVFLNEDIKEEAYDKKTTWF